MYIWMMLATFIVVLAAFNLSPRADLQKQQQTPMAEAAITKFLVQHDAAVKYAKAQLERYYADPENYAGLSAGLITGCQKETLTDDETEETTTTEIGALCNFLPIGFKYEENSYYSTVYCLNGAKYENVMDEETGEVTQNIVQQEGITSVAGCNDTANNAIYAVTYGRVPERWKNVSTHKVLAEFYNAMHSKVAIGSSCGIVVPKSQGENSRNVLNSNFVIQGIDVRNSSIPSYIYTYDNNFRSKCMSGNSLNSAFPCIIYVTAL